MQKAPNPDIASILRHAIRQLRGKGLESASLDAQVLLCHVLNRDRAFLFSHPEYRPTEGQLSAYSMLLKRRMEGEPLAYITGYKEFWRFNFRCNRHTLVPRPETETIIEIALDKFSSKMPDKILDLGTGTGVIGITLGALWPKSRVVLTDISFQALKIARQNASNILRPCKANHPLFVCCDWFSAISQKQHFDLITANPPYVSRTDQAYLCRQVLKYEPSVALFSRNDDGLGEILEILSKGWRYLSPNGWILCEIGFNQQKDVENMLKKIAKYKTVEFHRDISGVQRVVCVNI